MARPYMEGKKLPDEKYALILRTSRAEAALEALQQENGWISVNDRLPEAVYGQDGEPPEVSEDVLGFWPAGNANCDVANYDHATITHGISGRSLIMGSMTLTALLLTGCRYPPHPA
jgi:hypothetical protein